MKTSILSLVERPIAAILALLLAAPVAQAAPQQSAPAPSQPAVTQQQPVPTQQPETQPSAPEPAAPDAPSPRLRDLSASSSSSQSEQISGQNPVGTAAAPETKPTGIAASRPAGAAIAPAKQRRAKIILIRVGIIVAAGAAIGTVAGLSRGSSSRP